jgi:hypothetical protein
VRDLVGLDPADVACDAEEVGTPPSYVTDPPPPPPGDAARSVIATDYGLPHTYTEMRSRSGTRSTPSARWRSAGLPDIILHGTATWALAAREVLRAHAGGDVRRLKRLAGRFRAPVMAGAGLTRRHAVMPARGSPSRSRPTAGRWR